MLFSEPYNIGYVISDYKLALTNYLVHIQCHNYVTVEIDVQDDEYFTSCH